MSRVVVFGGGGFVGGAIIARLAQAGFQPVCAHRRACRAGDGIEQQRCDATDPAAVNRLLQGAHAVVNAVLGDADTMMLATQVLADAARAARLRLVHISSMAVYGAATGLVDEAAPLRGSGSYAEAKIECEATLAGSGAVVLRPGIVYGPGGEQWAGRIFRLLRARRLGDLGENGDGRCNFLHVRDLGAAVVACIRSDAAAGQAINLAQGVAPRWNSVFAACARAIGAVPMARIANWQMKAEQRLLAPPLYLAEAAAGRLGAAAPHPPDAITPSLGALFRQDCVLDTRRGQILLGGAQVAPAEGLAECARWFLQTYGRAGSLAPR